MRVVDLNHPLVDIGRFELRIDIGVVEIHRLGLRIGVLQHPERLPACPLERDLELLVPLLPILTVQPAGDLVVETMPLSLGPPLPRSLASLAECRVAFVVLQH